MLVISLEFALFRLKNQGEAKFWEFYGYCMSLWWIEEEVEFITAFDALAYWYKLSLKLHLLSFKTIFVSNPQRHGET
jgi:hypothetical protein